MFSFKAKPVRTSRLSISPRMRIACVLCASWRMLPRARFHHSATHENGLRHRKPLEWVARPAGIEPTTPWFVARYSIQLSYGRETRR